MEFTPFLCPGKYVSTLNFSISINFINPSSDEVSSLFDDKNWISSIDFP
jgi:hypothetical protein